MKKACILLGSPRKDGNTYNITAPFVHTLMKQGVDCTGIWLYDKKINPCLACRNCQNDWQAFGCNQKDDVHEIFDLVMESDLIVLASPIYSWYCTPPMKAMLDRLVYGMNKYYGDKLGPSLWAGKNLAIITTCGYEPEKGADLWEAGMKRYCKHSQMNYLGMLVERHMGYNTEFMDNAKAQRAGDFARKLLAKV